MALIARKKKRGDEGNKTKTKLKKKERKDSGETGERTDKGMMKDRKNGGRPEEEKNVDNKKKRVRSKSAKDLTEEEIKALCEEHNVPYTVPKQNEQPEDRKTRIKKLKSYINVKKSNANINSILTEIEMEVLCKDNAVTYIPPPENENLKDKVNRFQKLRNKMRYKRYNEKKNKKSMSGIDDQPSVNPVPHQIHPNPKVSESMKAFEEGEEKHSIATCVVCQETRPVFHTSYDNKSAHVKLNPWKVDKNGVCMRCRNERYKRLKKQNQAAKYSGYLSKEDDLGPASDTIRHNSQHFLPVPPYLQNLSAVELALVSKVTVCMNVHMLRYGMMSSKGHSISIPQRMAIATKLPLLPENVGIVVLRKKGSSETTRHYTVKRSKVEEAIKGLCYGSPIGGLTQWVAGTQKYPGPDHIRKPLKGRFFTHFPNEYYKDVEIQNDRINNLPSERVQFPQLKVIDIDKDIPEEEKGPAEEQFHVPYSETDESTTTSGITLPMEPKDADEELQSIINKLIGKGDNHEQIAVAHWQYADDEPLSELKTPGFFAMSFPSIFVNGSCDLTHNQLIRLDYNEWLEHIYFQGDGRVAKHPFLKFFLYNLGLRKQALQQGSYLVSQQLNESHISIDELKERIENNDDSIPRKIIKMGANLPNTDPYWSNRRQDLEAFTFYRRKENHDLPAYFHTNSMAELHWTPLIDLMAKYLSATTGKVEADLRTELSTDTQLLRRTVLENLHIATLYFDARTRNYYHTVCKDLFQCDDFFYRYEFAKARGQIHTHGLLFSQAHAKKIEEALDLENDTTNDEERAKRLHEWLQTDSQDENGVYSPQFTSLHPAGGKKETNNLGGVTWVPNKDNWASPEGTQEPPQFDPLRQKTTEMCKSAEDDTVFHTYMVNKVALHRCSGYCLRKKKQDSKNRYCRLHFGNQDPLTKKTSGKELHPFESWITNAATHPRYEGPRDHPRHVMHVKAHLLTWLANADTQPLIDQDLLNLQKYIVAYACKGHASTEELITIYKHLLNTSDTNASVKNVVHRLLMKLVGMIDVPAAAVDYLNAGGQLYHATRHFRRIGLSGYRPLNKSGNDENITKQTALDQFLSNKRRQENPNMSLWEWSIKCDCRTKCLSNHVPVYTGGMIRPVWPLSEDCCKYNLMIFSRGTWHKPEDLKHGYETFSESFAEFLESPDCNAALKEVVTLSKKRYEKKVEKDRRKAASAGENGSQSSQQQSQRTDTDSQMTCDSQLTCDSQDPSIQNLRLGQALLKDISDQNKEYFDKMAEEEVVLNNGGENFNWHDHAVESLGFQWNDDVKTWIDDISSRMEEQLLEYAESLDLPEVNLLYANPLQRVIIAMNIRKLLEVARDGIKNVEPLRLLVQGTGGTGKTFVITAISQIARRIFKRNGSVMNLAPTGSAANLLPDGCTVHSTLPPLNKAKKKEYKTAQMADHPLSHKSLRKLKKLIGSNGDDGHQLYCLNMDERSMFSHRLLAWSSQRLCEATVNYNNSFGSVPIVNFFGDLGQLGPIDAKDLHTQPSRSSAPDELAGYTIYRQFENCIVLQQTMRQKPEQKALLERLLRIRNGTITQQDWVDINARYENDLPPDEKKQFQHDEVITLHEIWTGVRQENRGRLAKLCTPVATIPSTGRGRHHKQGEKQVGQIVPKSLLTVGARIILTKNQGALTQFGLNNGAVGKVIAILYAEDCGPPSMPDAVICDFPAYRGTAWIDDRPTWVPIVPNQVRCDTNCCERTGMPLMPGYSIPVAKSQGMTVGEGKPSTHMRIKLLAEKFMEVLSLGTTYTAFSRVETESRWCLVEKIPQDRILYINSHPHMVARREEEKRLLALSEKTVQRFVQYLEVESYVNVLQELDEYCNDDMTSSICQNPSDKCTCMLCKSSS